MPIGLRLDRHALRGRIVRKMKGINSGASGISELSNELRRRIEEVRAQLKAKANAQVCVFWKGSRGIVILILGYSEQGVPPKTSLLSQVNPRDGTQKKGLGMECHPALSIESAVPKIRARHPSLGLLPKAEFATVKANQRAAPQFKEIQKPEAKLDRDGIAEFSDPMKNKHFDTSLQSLSSKAPKIRGRKVLKFVKKGKFVNEANKMRAKVSETGISFLSESICVQLTVN